MALEKIDPTTLDAEHTVVVATGNAHKLVEIEEILGAALPGTRFVAIGQLGDFDDPEETGTTFAQNAIIKAEAAVAETGFAAVADDSGLMVDALDGEPGVYSARYAGVHGNDAANNEKLLAKLEGVEDARRTARFASAIAFIEPSGLVTMGEGFCEGMIGREGRGDHGFGYDPLFLPNDTPGKTMAELEPQEKNAISHRFHALQDLCAKLGAGMTAGEDAVPDKGTASDTSGAEGTAL
ncbi:RdgB/HAM1 family non-canonical purine NTP pyrophosphatase [Enorma sp.]|uniref:RdgB/HAM1 family non-canonical purine NTP pyrophosphatase n=1 Tax=Enorma sp. TaxID=1920692 RepID=UPI003AB76DD5